MAKAIKTAIIAVVVAVVVIYGGAFLLQAAGQGVAFGAGATGAAGALAATSSVLTVAATTFVGTLVAAGIGAMSSRGGNFNTSNFGTKTASRQAIAPRQLVYGTCRVGGTIVHMETTGTNNTKLCMIIVVAGHPIDGLVSGRVGDTTATTASSTVSGETVFRVTNSELVNAENDNAMTGGSLIRFTFHDGTQTARDGLAAATLGNTSIPTTHKYIDCAYLYFEMIYDAEALPNIPPLSFVVRGKNVFDPRTNAAATTDLQRQNPALQVRDFLTDTVYGMKATTAEINDTTNAGGFAAAANTCDQNVTLSDGSTTERRYTSSGFTNFSATGESVLAGIQSAMGGRLSYTNGVFNLFAGAAQTPSLTITDDDLLTPVSVDTGSGGALGDLYNQVKGVYVSAAGDFKGAETPTVSDTTMLSQDTPSGESSNNYKKTLEVQLPFTTTETMAQRLARIQLRYQRKTLMLTLTVPMTYMRLQPNDFVRITNERLSFTNKLFEVQSVEMTLAPDDSGAFFAAVALVLREIASDVWDFATNEYSTSIGEGSVVSTGSLAVSAPTIGTLTQRATIQGPHTIIDIIVPWTNQQDDAIQGTEIQYKVSSESDYAVATVAGKGQTKGVIQNVVVGNTYNVRLRHFSFDNVYSGFSSQANIQIAESDTLAQPSGVSATTGKPFFIELKWTNPANTNLRAVEVHASTTNGFTPSTGTLVNSYYGDVGKNKRVLLGKSSDFGFDYNTTFYFRLRAINVLGTATAYTSQVAGSFTKAVSADIDSISANQITAGTIDASQIDVENLNAAKITTGEISVNRLPSAVVFTSELVDGTTIIDGSNIQTGEITLTSGDGSSNLAHIKGGKTSYEDTSNEGFFMGFNASSHPAFNIGTGTNFLKYDQSNGLTLRGALTAGDIASGGTLSGVNMSIGSGNSIFKASGSGIQLGHATFSSAPFRVTPAGALTASSATITGSITATSFNMSGGAKINAGDILASSSFFTTDGSGNLTLADDGVSSAKIASTLQSDNYSAGSAGWKIQKSGNAEFNGVVLSRSLVVATGTINVPDGTAGSGGIPAQSNDFQVLKEIYTTGVYSAGFNAWSGSTSTFMVQISMTGTFITTVGNETNAFFGPRGTLLPLTVFSGTQAFTLRTQLWGRQIHSFGQFGVSGQAPITLTYRIYKVT